MGWQEQQHQVLLAPRRPPSTQWQERPCPPCSPRLPAVPSPPRSAACGRGVPLVRRRGGDADTRLMLAGARPGDPGELAWRRAGLGGSGAVGPCPPAPAQQPLRSMLRAVPPQPQPLPSPPLLAGGRVRHKGQQGAPCKGAGAHHRHHHAGGGLAGHPRRQPAWRHAGCPGRRAQRHSSGVAAARAHMSAETCTLQLKSIM